MRRTFFFIIPVILILFSGCNDIAGGRSEVSDLPVDITTVTRGDVLSPGDAIEVEYTINDNETVPDRLEINITGPDGRVINNIVIEEQPLTGRTPPVEFDPESEEGLYTAVFDFYNGEELFYSETREFFIACSVSIIKSINSYPPVLYPGGGGLFYANVECSGDNCWLRWTLDGDNIAEGSVSGGYGSIEIEAPDSEGVYDLSLEVFPFAPEDDDSYGFESGIKKNIPLYVNTEQKSGVTEFGPAEDFYNLFHFRGSLYNSADQDVSGMRGLEPAGQPQLSVRNGIFGYYLDSRSGFTAGRLMVPVKDDSLQAFSFMTSVIPSGNYGESSGSESPGIFFSGYDDGSFYTSVDILQDGRLKASVYIDGSEFTLLSEKPMFYENTYSTIAYAVQPSETELKISWYCDGEPDSEISFSVPENGTAPWLKLNGSGKTSSSSLFGKGNFEGLVDEVGIYHNKMSAGFVVDPKQFRRAMELEYGKTLMYAEGFDGQLEELLFSGSGVSASDSRLLIPPGGSVGFPPIYPGYEEVMFRIELADAGSGESEAVFFADGNGTEIVSVDFSGEEDSEEPVVFSLVFSPESIGLIGTDSQDGDTGFDGDFSGIGYRIRNNSPEKNLVIESILVIRKNINISETETDESGIIRNTGFFQAEINIRS